MVLNRIAEKEFASIILQWFDRNRRDLPWRDTHDPYLIWLSEVILQQTRVSQGLAYYQSLTKTFPTVNDLAKAKESRVLRLWQGLGYYSRARNLHRCAKLVSQTMNGKFPATFDELVKLPGVGPYTAAAIASIAFGERVAVVDGNVFRVLSRIFGIDTDILSPAGKKQFQQKAASLVPLTRAGDFNQAVMELGAIQCLPRNPDCATCPFESVCVARQSDSIHLLPVKKKKVRTRKRHLNYVLFSSEGKIALQERSNRDIWQGLYDFHLVETERPASPLQLAKADKLLAKVGREKIERCGEMKHQLTHQLLHITFYQAPVSKKNLTIFKKVNPALSFYSLKQAARLPKPVPIKLMLERMRNDGK
jgi:A/G-specific adenine glycosylase